MSDTLYLQLDQNIQVSHPHVYLQDVAKLSCTDSKILNRLRVMPVINLPPDKPGRYVMSVMDLIRESFHRRNAAIRERCLLIMEILSGVYEHIEKMHKENAAGI